MNKREEVIEYLSGEESSIGRDRREAELSLLDDELWIVEPELRYGFEAEEAVKQWRRAADFARALAEGFDENLVGAATMQSLWDPRERTEEALRRAVKRLREPAA
jgi:hypothetical protein